MKKGIILTSILILFLVILFYITFEDKYGIDIQTNNRELIPIVPQLKKETLDCKSFSSTFAKAFGLEKPSGTVRRSKLSADSNVGNSRSRIGHMKIDSMEYVIEKSREGLIIRKKNK